MTSQVIASCECAPNIALIKYWGKSNEDLVFPLNGSISITLDSQVLNSRTCITLNTDPNQPDRTTIHICLDGSTQEFTHDDNSRSKSDLINKKRFNLMLSKVRRNCGLENPNSYNVIRIVSRNSFPTGCGMASSASGFASLAHCLSRAFRYNGDTSELARLGSGSACRSCFGGFVLWSKPTLDSPETSLATQLFPSSHWPQLNILALVFEDKKKKVTSTDGMRESVLTSELIKYRVKLVEEERLSQMKQYLAARDFESVSKLTIKDSNNFHAICMDTEPPLFYLNEKSKQIVSLVNEFNSKFGTRLAYTFDAGPNPFLFFQDDDLNDVLYVIYELFVRPHQISDTRFIDEFVLINKSKVDIDVGSWAKPVLGEFCASFRESLDVEGALIKRLIHSKPGDEPAVYDYDKFSLI